MSNQDVASHTNGVLPLTPHKFNTCFTSCLHKPAKHIKSPWSLRVLWRYIYVWAIDDTISSIICEKYSRSTFRIARYLGTYWALASVANFALLQHQRDREWARDVTRDAITILPRIMNSAIRELTHPPLESTPALRQQQTNRCWLGSTQWQTHSPAQIIQIIYSPAPGAVSAVFLKVRSTPIF